MPKGVPKTYKTYRARRTQRLGYEDRLEGQLVPEAIEFLRVESLVRTGFLTEVEVSKAELVAAINEFCPASAKSYGLPVNREASAAHAARMERFREAS